MLKLTDTWKKGFTIIELLIVVLIISIIAAIAIPNFMAALQRSRQRRSMSDMRTLSTAVETYKIDFSRPPQNPNILSLVNTLQPIYVKVLPKLDGWQREFNYIGGVEVYTLETYGKDGIDGGNISPATKDDFDLDIVLVDGFFTAAPS